MAILPVLRLPTIWPPALLVYTAELFGVLSASVLYQFLQLCILSMAERCIYILHIKTTYCIIYIKKNRTDLAICHLQVGYGQLSHKSYLQGSVKKKNNLRAGQQKHIADRQFTAMMNGYGIAPCCANAAASEKQATRNKGAETLRSFRRYSIKIVRCC